MVEHGYTRNGVEDIKKEPSVLDQQIKGAFQVIIALPALFPLMNSSDYFLSG